MAEILESPWLVAGVAFALGLVVGWMAWGRPWRNGPARNDLSAGNGGADAARDVSSGVSDSPDDALGSVLAEVKKAKAMLDGADDAEAAMGKELDRLDQAVKRANGRLKLILKSADRAKDTN